MKLFVIVDIFFRQTYGYRKTVTVCNHLTRLRQKWVKHNKFTKYTRFIQKDNGARKGRHYCILVSWF